MEQSKIHRKTARTRSVRSLPPALKRRRSRDKLFNYKKRCICLTGDDGIPVTEFPKVWNDLRLNNQLCDGIIKSSDDKNIPVHRAIVSAVSPYFKILFIKNSKTNAELRSHVIKVNLPAFVIEQMLNYAYTGICDVNRENVQELLPAATRFEFLGVIQQCCQFILKQLTPQNCFSILKFGKPYFCHKMEGQVWKYIRHNFKDIHLCNTEILETSSVDLAYLLSHDELNVRHEELVFDCVIKWISHDPPNRERHLLSLSNCIRYGQMSYKFFEDTVLKNHFVEKNKAVVDILKPLSSFLTTFSKKPENLGLDLNLAITRPRIPYQILFAIGGWSAGSPTSFVETYDTRADRWYLATSTDAIARAYHGICSLNNLIYMIGGFDGNEHFNSVRCYDPVTRIWEEKACMYHARCYVSVVVLDGYIYAMGGFNGRNRLDSVERYDFQVNQWLMMASMNRHRSDASAAALGNKIYIAGGFNGSEVLRSAEFYDPAVNQWTYIHPMHTARSGVSLVAYHNKLYALGGFNGVTRLQTVEVCDPRNSSSWREINEMFSPRSNFTSVILDDMIFVIGGFNGSTTIPYVECYDDATNEWFDAQALNLNRSALGACVLSGLPNTKDYSYLSKVHDGSKEMPPNPQCSGDGVGL